MKRTALIIPELRSINGILIISKKIVISNIYKLRSCLNFIKKKSEFHSFIFGIFETLLTYFIILS